MTIDQEAAVAAMLREVDRRTPTMARLMAEEVNAGLGSDVTIPAIWMRIILAHIQQHVLLVRTLRQDAIGSLPRTGKPADDDADAAYAGDLAQHAIGTHGDNLPAAMSLFRAGISILISTVPAPVALSMVEALAELFDLKQKLGIGEVRQ